MCYRMQLVGPPHESGPGADSERKSDRDSVLAKGEAEIENLGAALARDPNIFRLDIAVHNACRMRLRPPARKDRVACSAAAARGAGNRAATRLRSAQRPCRPCGPAPRCRRPRQCWFEARAASGVRGHLRRKNLQRDGAVEAQIAGAIHLAHAAHARQGLSLIRAELCSRGRHPKVTILAMRHIRDLSKPRPATACQITLDWNPR